MLKAAGDWEVLAVNDVDDTCFATPATLIVNGQAPFTMADLGMISLAFGTVVVATVYALGHVSGNHINPAVTLGLAATGKFPWRQVPSYLAAQVVMNAMYALCKGGHRPSREQVLAQVRKTNMKATILGTPLRFAKNGNSRYAPRWVAAAGR